MVSRENRVLIAFVLAAVALAYGGRAVTDLSDSVLIAVLLFVGTVAPLAVNGYLDRRETE